MLWAVGVLPKDERRERRWRGEEVEDLSRLDEDGGVRKWSWLRFLMQFGFPETTRDLSKISMGMERRCRLNFERKKPWTFE